MHDLKGLTILFWAFKMQEWFAHNGFKRGEINEETFDREITNRIRDAFLSAHSLERHQVKCTCYLKDGWVPYKGNISIEITDDAWGYLKQ